MEPVHKTSPCHLYKHRIGDDQDGSHLMKAQQVGIFASGKVGRDLLDVPRGIQVLHFESGHPAKGANHNYPNHKTRIQAFTLCYISNRLKFFSARKVLVQIHVDVYTNEHFTV